MHAKADACSAPGEAMSEFKITTPNGLSSLIQCACTTADKMTDTLGFLPESALAEAADDGRVLVAIDDNGHYLGHLLFWFTSRDPRRARVQQTCVHPQFRNRGVGRALVEALIARSSHCDSIDLYCVRDSDLPAFWQSLGFDPIGEKEGRGRRRRTLTHMRRTFPHATLYSSVRDTTIMAAMDLNVVIGLQDDRPNVRFIQDDAFVDLFRLVVTSSVLREINADERTPRRRKRQNFAKTFWHESLNPHDRDHAAKRVTDALSTWPGRAPSDHDREHLIEALAIGADVLLTSDEHDLGRCSAHILEMLGLRILTPFEFVRHLDELRDTSSYAPARLSGTTISFKSVGAHDIRSLCDAFLNTINSESKRAFKAVMNTALLDAVRQGSAKVLEINQRSQGLLIASQQQGHWVAPVARLARGVSSMTIAAALIHAVLHDAMDRTLRSVRILDNNAMALFSPVLAARGFVRTRTGSWQKWLPDQPLLELDQAVGTLQAIARQLSSDDCVTLLECIERLKVGDSTSDDIVLIDRLLWPALTLARTADLVILPIQPHFAERLFDYGLASESLFEVEPSKLLNHEHIFYRSGTGLLPRPGTRIAWYVSRDNRSGPSGAPGAIRAISTVIEALRLPPEDAYRRFRRIGVYEKSDVMQTSTLGGKIMAIRFGSVIPLAQPVSVSALRQSGYTNLQAPIKIAQSATAARLREWVNRGHNA